MKAKTKIGMGMKAKEKAGKKKETNTSNGETKRRVTDFANFGCSRVLNRQRNQRGKSDKRQESRATSLEELQRRTMETRGQRLYLAPYKYRRELYLVSYKGGRGVTAKKRKKEKKPSKRQ
ncbi:hypothetical protein P5V15_013830 [Pogonomyrmex californicus]